MLTDREIRAAKEDGRLDITPYDLKMVEPASYDLTLGEDVKIFTPTLKEQGFRGALDIKEPVDHLFLPYKINPQGLVIAPQDFILATTEQRVRLGDEIIGRVEGKSSLGRLGLLVHVTAGYIDPGFDGEITLELKNLLPVPIRIYAGMKIAQLSFLPALDMAEGMWGYAGRPYSGKYQGQTGPAIPQMWRNFQ